MVNTLVGKSNALIKSHRTDENELFGKGSDQDPKYWMALLRQALVAGYLRKDIETYGVVKLTEKGEKFLKKPESFMMTEDHIYEVDGNDGIVTAAKGTGGGTDEKLVKMLKELRKKVAKKLGVPPFVVFQDPSIEDMALKVSCFYSGIR